MKPKAMDSASQSSGGGTKGRALMQESSSMRMYLVTLAGREEAAEGTMTFRFEKPEESNVKTEQAVTVGLVDPPAGRRPSRLALWLAEGGSADAK